MMTKDEIKEQKDLIEAISMENDDEKLQKECRRLLRMGKSGKVTRPLAVLTTICQ